MKKIEQLRKDEKELAEEFKKATDEGNALAELLPDPKDKSKVMDDILKDMQMATSVFYLARIAEHTAYIADALDKMNEPPYRTLNRNSEFSAGTILGDADIQKMFKRRDEDGEQS